MQNLVRPFKTFFGLFAIDFCRLGHLGLKKVLKGTKSKLFFDK